MMGVTCRCGRRAVSRADDAALARAAFKRAGWDFMEFRDDANRLRMREYAICPACIEAARQRIARAEARYEANKEAF